MTTLYLNFSDTAFIHFTSNCDMASNVLIRSLEKNIDTNFPIYTKGITLADVDYPEALVYFGQPDVRYCIMLIAQTPRTH